MLRGACGCGGGRMVGLKRFFESDVGGGGGVVVGGWSKITIAKEKRLTQRSQP